MAETGAKSGFGTTIAFNSNTYGEVVSVTGPNGTRTMIDATHMTSPDNCKEFIGGLIDSGEIQLECNFIKSHYLAAQTAMGLSASAAFTLTLPSSLGTCTGNGWVSSLGPPTAQIDDRVTYTMTIKCTGKATWA